MAFFIMAISDSAPAIQSKTIQNLCQEDFCYSGSITTSELNYLCSTLVISQVSSLPSYQEHPDFLLLLLFYIDTELFL